MYTFDRFGAITLPLYNRTSVQSPAPAREAIVQTIAGAFDSDGSGRSMPKWPQTLSLRCIVAEDSKATQRTVLDALRAAVGLRGKLYRIADSDASSQRAPCRLVALEVERNQKDLTTQEVQLRFQQLGPWQGTVHSGPWTLDSGVLLDEGYALDVSSSVYTFSTPTTVWLSNGGNLPHSDVIMAVTATSGTLYALGITATGADMVWSGVLNAGHQLLVDFGAQAVTVDGNDAYAGLELTDNHTIEEWLLLNPGANSLYLNPVGGATVQVTFQYVDRWA